MFFFLYLLAYDFPPFSGVMEKLVWIRVIDGRDAGIVSKKRQGRVGKKVYYRAANGKVGKELERRGKCVYRTEVHYIIL